MSDHMDPVGRFRKDVQGFLISMIGGKCMRGVSDYGHTIQLVHVVQHF